MTIGHKLAIDEWRSHHCGSQVVMHRRHVGESDEAEASRLAAAGLVHHDHVGQAAKLLEVGLRGARDVRAKQGEGRRQRRRTGGEREAQREAQRSGGSVGAV